MQFQEKFKFCPSCGSNTFVTNDSKSKQCNSCGFTYYFNSAAASVAFIRNEDGHLLVCRRAFEPAKGTLDLPGGFIDNNESAEEGIAREVEEEIGVSIKEFRYLFSIPNEYLYSDLEILTLDLFFETEIPNNQKILANDDVEECFFIPIDKLNPQLFGLKSIKEAIKRYMLMYGGKQEKIFYT